jgi:hypothetical protein
MHRLATQHRAPLRRGFTLTELLISVGLALLVLYGINRVFTATATTIGTGQALSDANRSLLSAHTQFVNDIEGYGGVAGTGMLDTANQPLIVIRHEVVNAWMDANDFANDSTQTDALDEVIAGTVQRSDRQHRVDTLSFFSAGTFQRRTGQKIGSAETLVNSLEITAKAAFIHYGHARLPNDVNATNLVQYNGANFASANYFGPGERNATENPKNFYASQWILARNAVLLKPRNGVTREMYDGNGSPMVFFRREWVGATPQNNGTPFAFGDPVTLPNHVAVMNNSTADDVAPPNPLAAPADSAFTATPGPLIQHGLYDIATFNDDLPEDTGVRGATPGLSTGLFASIQAFQTGAPGTWWQAFVPAIGYRFNCNPFTRLNGSSGALADTYKAALASNAFVPGCTQFIVDFAADLDGDGAIDRVGGTGGIQWYGLNGTTATEPPHPTDASVVVPTGPFMRGTTAGTLMVNAWGPAEMDPLTPLTSRPPKLIRITLQVRDPSGRLPDGIWREFVFRVKP